MALAAFVMPINSWKLEKPEGGWSTETRRNEEREREGCAKSREGEELPRDSPARWKERTLQLPNG